MRIYRYMGLSLVPFPSPQFNATTLNHQNNNNNYNQLLKKNTHKNGIATIKCIIQHIILCLPLSPSFLYREATSPIVRKSTPVTSHA